MNKINQILVLILSVTLLVSVFAMIPTLAGALPEELAEILTESEAGYSFSLPQESLHESDPPSEISGEYSEFENMSREESEISDETSVDLTDAKFVQAINLCWYEKGQTPTMDIMNHTDYKLDLDKCAHQPYMFAETENPTVLIVHTHGTECFLGDGVDYYFDGEDFRSDDPDDGVVAVGEALKEALEKNGIRVIHDTTMYDAESFSGSYAASRKAVQKQLDENSDIVMVIDLHRDSVFTSSGENRKPITNIDGVDCAQVMLVVGSDSQVSHPHWRDNLVLAAKLQNVMNAVYPTLARPVCVKTAAYNQDLSTGSLLIEVGACGNTIAEAKAAAEPLANSIAILIKSTK